MQFMVDSQVKVEEDKRGTFVANVRVVAPGYGPVERPEEEIKQEAMTKTKKKQAYKNRGSRPPEEAQRLAKALNSANSFDFSNYPRFASIITMRDQLQPKKRPMSWLMTAIEEIYDERYTHDTVDLRNEGAEEPSERLSNIFPVFVVDSFSKRFGLRSLVDQNCWDMLFNVHALRKQHLEVEVFARFLEEFYDPDDLLFFLYVRSVVQKMLGVTFRTRWKDARGSRAPKTLVLDKKQCISVSRTVFGSDQDPMFKEFMSMIEQELVGTKGGKGPNTQRIEVCHFLHLAVVGYHETRPDDEGGGGDLSDSEQEQLFQQAEAEYDALIQQYGQDVPSHEEKVSTMEDALRTVMDSSGRSAEDDQIAQWAESLLSGGGMNEPVDSYLDHVSDDRAAFDQMERGLNDQQMSQSPPQQQDLAQELLHKTAGFAQAYVQDLMEVQCAGLPEEVVNEIEAETSSQLESKTQLIVENISRPGGTPVSEEYATLVSEQNASALDNAFMRLKEPGRSASEMDMELSHMGQAIVQLPELKQEIEPLVQLLTSYASSRLQDDEQ